MEKSISQWTILDESVQLPDPSDCMVTCKMTMKFVVYECVAHSMFWMIIYDVVKDVQKQLNRFFMPDTIYRALSRMMSSKNTLKISCKLLVPVLYDLLQGFAIGYETIPVISSISTNFFSKLTTKTTAGFVPPLNQYQRTT